MTCRTDRTNEKSLNIEAITLLVLGTHYTRYLWSAPLEEACADVSQRSEDASEQTTSIDALSYPRRYFVEHASLRISAFEQRFAEGVEGLLI